MAKDPRVLQLKDPGDMLAVLKDHGKLMRDFKKGDTIHVWNKMEKNYSYTLDVAPGTNFGEGFHPRYTPGEMLAMGVFEGKYLNDCLTEFPAEWFLEAIRADKLRPTGPTVEVNYTKADSRLPLSEWRRKGWVPGNARPESRSILSDAKRNPDERGWFQWYCRYWLGRRIPDLDAEQIARWRAFKRHAGGVKANCSPGDMSCRPRQRQALLQWSWNPRI
jgi:hypothetical protein